MDERSGEFWAGVGVFVILLTLFAVILPYSMWNAHNETKAKIVACSHAPDVTNCLKQIGAPSHD